MLDEIDHLQDDSLLYQLSRARENDLLEQARVSIVGISNDLSYRERLSPKVRSSLCERSINFPAYDANELREVLRQRQSIAFQDGVLGEEVIPLCAAYGAQESGDARKALDLLLKAGDMAQMQGDEEVNDDHVRKGREKLKQEAVSNGIVGLNEHERVLLYAVATFEGADACPVRSRDLYRRYESLVEQSGNDALTIRWMHDHIDELDMLGLISVEKRNEGASGGQYKTVALNQDLDLVVDALSETVEEVGVHQNVVGVLKE